MRVSASCQIRAPQAKVFEAFSDLEALPKHVKAIAKVELLTPGEVGVGTRFRETRVMFGSEQTETMEVTAFAPPDSLREEARSGGMHYVSLWRFTEVDGVTTVSIDFVGTPERFLARAMNVVFSLMTGSMKKAFLADMSDLKAVLEG